MKVLFLDIDGVINCRRTSLAFNGYPHDFGPDGLKRFDWVAVGLIRVLCENTGAAIVLSSDWRYSCKPHEAANALDLPIIDFTPILLHSYKRGHEIEDWLKDHPNVTQYAIVDDRDWMLEHQEPYFVRTSEDDGLTIGDWSRLYSILRDRPDE